MKNKLAAENGVSLEQAIKEGYLTTMRLMGRGETRRSLQRLVNEDAITLQDAQEVWSSAFGNQTRLIAVRENSQELSA